MDAAGQLTQATTALLQGLRDIATEEGALLCFDEVMTGFRIAKGCAQAHFGITPDLTTMGKVIGGGLPVGAYGGRKDIMQTVAPAGPMYQVGVPVYMDLWLGMASSGCLWQMQGNFAYPGTRRTHVPGGVGTARNSAGSDLVLSLATACPTAGARGTMQTVVLAALGQALCAHCEAAMQCCCPTAAGT